MRVIDVESINESMQNETEFVLQCEEAYHDKINTACCEILDRRSNHPVVALTGPSGSGKTTTALRLQEHLENLGVEVSVLSMDNFFLPMDKRPEEAQKDWESPLCVDVHSLVAATSQILDGKEVKVPVFDYANNTIKEYVKLKGNKDGIVIVEGIHMLNPLIFDKIRGVATGVYVAPRTRIITKEDVVVRPEQLRVARRLLRDYSTRGRSLRATVEGAQSVNRGEVNYIMPYKGNANIHIDSFHDYEPCILAKHLIENPQFKEELTEEFMKEHGLENLLHVVNSVAPLHCKYVPKNSLVREFIGGSRFTY